MSQIAIPESENTYLSFCAKSQNPTKDWGSAMNHDKSKNDELRDEEREHDERRQHLRDEAFDATGETDDIGSQDARRKEGDEAH